MYNYDNEKYAIFSLIHTHNLYLIPYRMSHKLYMIVLKMDLKLFHITGLINSYTQLNDQIFFCRSLVCLRGRTRKGVRMNKMGDSWVPRKYRSNSSGSSIQIEHARCSRQREALASSRPPMGDE